MTSVWETAESTLGTMLSQCVSFQAYVGAADATAALARVFFTALPDPSDLDEGRTQVELEAVYPCALIDSDALNYTSTTFGNANQYSPSGEIMLMLAKCDDPALSQAANAVARKAEWGAIIDELLGLTGPNGLNIANLRILSKKLTSIEERPTIGGIDQGIPGRVRDVAELELAIAWSNGEP